MNQRIKELSKQAAQAVNPGFRGSDWQREYEKKFAELIVKMCADYADMAQDAGCEYSGDYVAEAMGYGTEEGITEWRAK